MLKCSLYDYLSLYNIICTVRHALRAVNIKALLLHALRRTVVIKYMSLLLKPLLRPPIKYIRRFFTFGSSDHLELWNEVQGGLHADAEDLALWTFLQISIYKKYYI